MGYDRINEPSNDTGIDQIGQKLGSFGNCAGNNGRGGGGKYKLEKPCGKIVIATGEIVNSDSEQEIG